MFLNLKGIDGLVEYLSDELNNRKTTTRCTFLNPSSRCDLLVSSTAPLHCCSQLAGHFDARLGEEEDDVGHASGRLC